MEVEIDSFSAWVIGIVVVVVVALAIWRGRQPMPTQEENPEYYWDA